MLQELEEDEEELEVEPLEELSDCSASFTERSVSSAIFAKSGLCS